MAAAVLDDRPRGGLQHPPIVLWVGGLQEHEFLALELRWFGSKGKCGDPRLLAYRTHGRGGENAAMARNDDVVIRFDQIPRERKGKRPAAVADAGRFEVVAIVARRDCRGDPAIDRNID